MKGRGSREALVALAALALVMGVAAGSGGAGTAASKPIGKSSKVVFFVSDGMRPDLMEKYAAAGFMPTYKKLMKDGVTGQNGLVQA
jgi:predicted AlkP superfamily pyrophosphatase or phosphodiesterase